MTFLPSTPEDLPVIAGLYREAIEYQRSKSATHYWHGMNLELITLEIRDRLHWKIVVDDRIACFFSIAFTDPLVWDERDAEPSLYLHRIVTNPLFRGNGYVKHIIAWAEEYGRMQHRYFIRLDTGSENQKLNSYYLECGFTYCGEKKFSRTDASPGIPEHYRGHTLTLFERKITEAPGPSPSTEVHTPEAGS